MFQNNLFKLKKVMGIVYIIMVNVIVTTQAQSGTTSLVIDHYSITKQNIQFQWINFTGIASNGKTYNGSITCYPAHKTYNNKDHGSMHVLRTSYDAGAYLVFSYEECLDMIENLRNDMEDVKLSWDQDGFDEIKSTPLSFLRYIH